MFYCSVSEKWWPSIVLFPRKCEARAFSFEIRRFKIKVPNHCSITRSENNMIPTCSETNIKINRGNRSKESIDQTDQTDRLLTFDPFAFKNACFQVLAFKITSKILPKCFQDICLQVLPKLLPNICFQILPND